MKRGLLMIVLCVAVATGCVNSKRFRYVHNQPTCFRPPANATDPVPGNPSEQRLQFPSVDCATTFYKTGFVEFYEDGGYVDPVQRDKVLALIDAEKARAPGGKVITLVYVHGWKNNGNVSSVKPKDVERFTSALVELGTRARLANPDNPVPVIGVYIGWRGKSLRGPGWFTFLSYWGRRNTANSVGDGGPLTKVLNDVIEKTNGTAANDASRVMLVGHSFGARVLEHAVESGVTLYDEANVRGDTVVRPRVDLVLYVNSANDARLSMTRVQRLREKPIVVRHPDYDPAKCAAIPRPPSLEDQICKEYPLLVTIMSKGDLATKYLQPVATSIFPDRGSAQDPPQPPQGQFADRTPSPVIYRRASAGHMPFMHSHVVTEIICPRDPRDGVACNPEDPACAFAFRTRGDCDACFKASLRGPVDGKSPFNQTAFWIMNIDTRISKDHGDIWNQSFLDMVGALMAPRGFFEPGSPRMQIRAQ
jgi:hypothetical protein